MNQNNKDLKDFCSRHSIRVLDTSKRATRHNGLNINLFRHKEDYNIIDTEVLRFETEALYTIEIAESELERISQFESQVFNNMKENGHYRLFETLMEQKQRESELKKAYPAVKKAYEHYSLMLKMAETGDI